MSDLLQHGTLPTQEQVRDQGITTKPQKILESDGKRDDHSAVEQRYQ